MYAGSSYAPTSGAGTSSAKQTFSAKATSTGGFAAAATAKDDDGPGYGQLYSNTAMALTAAGATLKAPTQAVYNPMNLYSSQNMQEISTEINDYLRGTAIDDAMREALNLPEIYQGVPTEEEPDPNITDPDVLRDALQPEPITVEELPDVTVKAGDTLTAIAEANNLPVQDVIDANPQIANPDMIRPGEVVKLSSRFDTKGATGLTTFYEDIGKKAESDHGSTPVPTKDARETKEYIDGKLNPNYIANPEDRSKDVGYGHKVTAAEEASGKIRGVTFKNEDGTYKDLTEEDKVTILNADMQAHTKAARDAGWDTKLANIGTSWNQLDPSYQRALTSLAYNVGGRKAGEQWTAVLRAAKDRDVTEFARQLRRKDAGRYTAGMDNRVMKELKFAGLIDKRRDVSSVLPLADRRSGIAN